MKIRIDGTVTPIRLVVGLVMYSVGIALVWPPTWGEAFAIGVCSAAFVTLYDRVDVEI